MSRKINFLLRCCTFVIGMTVASCGIALVTNANLGTTPITSIPLTCNAILPLSVGGYTAILNAMLLAAQKPILGPNFKISSLLQLPPILFFSMAIDVWLHLTAFMHGLPYPERFAFLLLGIVILAAGIFIQVASNVTVMPGEGIVMAVAWRTRLSFGTIKVLLDCTMVVIAASAGFICLGTVVGIREGTLASAVLTGFVVRFITWCARRLKAGPGKHS